MSDTLQDYYNKHNGRLPTEPIPDEPKTMGRPRILNNPDVPDNHICSKCKNDKTKVTFKIQNGNPSRWCNICLNGMNTPIHIRRENIANKINECQQ